MKFVLWILNAILVVSSSCCWFVCAFSQQFLRTVRYRKDAFFKVELWVEDGWSVLKYVEVLRASRLRAMFKYILLLPNVAVRCFASLLLKLHAKHRGKIRRRPVFCRSHSTSLEILWDCSLCKESDWKLLGSHWFCGPISKEAVEINQKASSFFEVWTTLSSPQIPANARKTRTVVILVVFQSVDFFSFSARWVY